MTWQAPSNNGGGTILAYEVFVGGAYAATVAGTQFTWHHDVAYDNTNRIYQVRAQNQAGWSSLTEPVATTPCDQEPPIATGAPVVRDWSPIQTYTLTGATWRDDTWGTGGQSGFSSNTALVRYSIGSTSGAVDRQGWTDFTNAPAEGAATYSPTDALTDLWPGRNYVNVRVFDRAGNTVTTNGAYEVRVDDSVPTLTGSTINVPSASTWASSPSMSLSGAQFTDTTSGFQVYAKYAVTPTQAEPTSGWSNWPTTPTAGSLTWNVPSVAYNAIGSPNQGHNHVWLEVKDLAGNTRRAIAYDFRFDNAGDTVTGLVAKTQAGGSTIPPDTWQTDNTPRWEWTVPSSGSPVSGYSYSLSTTSTAAPNTLLDLTDPYYDSAGNPLADGSWYFRTRSRDEAGNWGPTTNSYTVLIDTTNPTVTAGNPTQTEPWTNGATPPFYSSVCVTDARSGLQSAAYWVGRGPGDTSGTSRTPPGLTVGMTTQYCPAIAAPLGDLVQGADNYVTLRVTDRAGNQLITTAYRIRYDTIPNAVPYLSMQASCGGSTLPDNVWQNDATPCYSWTAPSVLATESPISGYDYALSMTNQDPGMSLDTSSTSYSPGAIASGTWYFKVRARDEAGNWGPIQGPRTLRIDAVLPSTPTVTSTTHPSSSSYYNRTSLTVSWSASDTPSGVDGYYYQIGTSSCPSSLVSTGTYVEETTTTVTFTGLGPFGAYKFCVQAKDAAGNVGGASTLVANVDAVAPSFTLVAPQHGSVTDDVNAEVIVLFEETDNGADLLSQATNVDVNSVKLFVDGQDVIAAWKDLCGPGTPLNTAGQCKLEVGTGGVHYIPLVPWQDGAHDVFASVGDAVVDANTAQLVWSFIEYSGAGLDDDGDRISNPLEPLICGRELVRDLLNNATGGDLGRCLSASSYLPPSAGITVFVPLEAQMAVDADGDTVPSHVTFKGFNLTLDPFRPAVARVGPAPDVVLTVDPADNDPNAPAPSTVTIPAPLPVGIVWGPDMDGDMVPSSVTVARANLSFDRRNPTNPLTFAPAPGQTTGLDSNDDDSNDPASSTFGPIPIPTGASHDVDQDGDRIPHMATVSWLDVSIDRTQENPIVIGSHTTSTLLDADDADANSPVPFDPFDADQDLVPDAVEPWICLVQDETTAQDGRCVQPDGSGADGSGDNYVPPLGAPNPWNMP